MADKEFLPKAEPLPIEKQGMRGIASALRPIDPAKQGQHNLLCHKCGTVLVEGASADALTDFEGIKCYACGAWNTGQIDQASP